MKAIIRIENKKKFCIELIVLLCLLFSCYSYSQCGYQYCFDITGPTSVSAGQTTSYTLEDNGAGYDYFWTTETIATFTESGSSDYYGINDNDISVTWNAESSMVHLSVEAFDSSYIEDYYGEIFVTVLAAAPSTPTAPTIQSNNCGNTVLQRGTPPSGVTWYWQSSSTGTSTSNSGSTITLTSGTIYYLRARNGDGTWSTNSSNVSYSIDEIPNVPDIPNIANNCGNTVLTKGSAPSGVTWYWQSSATGTSTSNSSSSVTRTNGTVYYLRARNNSSGCWSTARTVNYSVDAVPSVPSAPTIATNCGNTVLTKGSSPSGITWYWQSSATGTSTSNSSSSVTRTSGTVYYLRARNNSTGCWSTATTVNYTVDAIPNAPDDPTVNSSCGSVVLTKGSAPSGVTWYWQGSATGTSTANANASVTLTSGTVYYLRARHNTSQCWSATTTINYLVPEPTTTWYVDNDGDGYGDSGNSQVGCSQPVGYVGNDDDYDDTDPLITNIAPSTFYLDSDNDTFGDPTQSVFQSEAPADYVANNTDCDDTNAQINPNTTWYLDADDDGHAASGGSFQGCTPPNANDYTYTTITEDDCDDSDPSAFESVTWYLDADGDGHSVSSVQSCGSPGTGYVLNVTGTSDCNDNSYDPSNDCSTPVDPNPTDQNYIYTRTYQEERSSVPTAQFDTDNGYVQDITYFDGLGRPMQKNAIRQSPVNGTDIITHVGYDDYGRMEKEWIPMEYPTGNIGEYRTIDMELATESFYQNKYPLDFPTETNPYSQKEFEPSPLNRVLKQAAPGEDWKLVVGGADNTIGFAYETNTTADNVALFEVTTNEANNTYVPTLVKNSTYVEGELFKNLTKDENHTSGNNHTTEEFTDKQGRVILKRTYNAGVAHDTYYVYDDFGNLTYVLPPKMEASTESLANINAAMDELGYQYVYDHRNRLVEKQIPGKGREYIVYNKLDQPVMTQDANQRSNNEWLFTKYDAFGRVAYTGLHTHPSAVDRETMQGFAENTVTYDQYESRTVTSQNLGGITIYYSNDAIPQGNIEIYTINYYDNYVDTPTGAPASVVVWGSDPQENNATNVRGLATVSKVKVLTTNDWINTLSYYDKKGRPIYTYSENEYLSTVDIVESKLDFVGKPEQVRTVHTKNGTTIVTLDNFTYDHVGRLLRQTQCIGDDTLGYGCDEVTVENDIVLDQATVTTSKTASNSITVVPPSSTDAVTLSGTLTLKINASAGSGGSGADEELIVYNSYDELGQLQAKKVGGAPGTDYDNTAGLQTVDYTYNVRGWLKKMESSLFDLGINYNTVAHGGTPLYNGNIAETEWKTANDNVQRWYSYDYDALNRITGATDNTGSFNVSNISYDKNGNILTLNRKGHIVGIPVLGTNGHFGDMDILDYDYDNGNKLTKVSDTGNTAYGFKDGTNSNDDFEYDSNGNLKIDRNKGITDIECNHLNLPTRVSFGSQNVQYVYDAAGTKLKKISGTGTVTEYANGHVYEENTLQFFGQPEGYVSVENGSYNYIYQYSDHVGNIRLSYTDSDGNGSIDPNTEIVDENNYYPFGLRMRGFNSNVSPLGNSVAKKFKYNGIEFEESLGIDLYEMDFRQYDPAIGRFTSMDPVTHFNLSPYQAFDNNPIYWADPSGANSVQDLIDEASKHPGVKFTSNGDGTFSGGGHTIGTKNDPPQEGQTRGVPGPQIGMDGAITRTEYYHRTGDDTGKWLSETEYFESFRYLIRAIGQGRTSIDVLGSYNFTDDVLVRMVAWAAQAYDYYGGEVPAYHDGDFRPVQSGFARPMYADSPIFIAFTFSSRAFAVFKAPVRVNNAKIISQDVLLIERKALNKALAEDVAQLNNGRELAKRIRANGGTPNPHGLQKEIDEIIPNRIQAKRDRINEIDKLLGN